MPSLQLGVEDPGANSSNCGEGYSCAYTNSISWVTPTKPLPMEINPQVVFERLFGDGGSTAERAARREEDRSMLDQILQHAGRFKKRHQRRRPPPRRRIPGRRARDRAPPGDRPQGLRPPSQRMETPYGVPIVLRRTHQAAIRFAGAGVPGRHHARFDHCSMRATSPAAPTRKAAPPPVSMAARTTPRIRPTFSTTRRSTPIT